MAPLVSLFIASYHSLLLLATTLCVAPFLYLLDNGVPSWDIGYRCLALGCLSPVDPAERHCGNSFRHGVKIYEGLGRSG